MKLFKEKKKKILELKKKRNDGPKRLEILKESVSLKT